MGRVCSRHSELVIKCIAVIVPFSLFGPAETLLDLGLLSTKLKKMSRLILALQLTLLLHDIFYSIFYI